MAIRALPALLVAAALATDGRLAFYLLLAAVPAAAAAALAEFGDLVELPGRAPGEASARVRAGVAGLGLFLVVAAAAAYGQAATGLAASASVGFLLLASAQGAFALAGGIRTAVPRRRPAPARQSA